MIEKEQKFILFASNKLNDHLKLYIDAELKAIDGTWCFFCHNKLNKKSPSFHGCFFIKIINLISSLLTSSNQHLHTENP